MTNAFWTVRFRLTGDRLPEGTTAEMSVCLNADDSAHAGVKAALVLGALGITEWALISCAQEFELGEVEK